MNKLDKKLVNRAYGKRKKFESLELPVFEKVRDNYEYSGKMVEIKTKEELQIYLEKYADVKEFVLRNYGEKILDKLFSNSVNALSEFVKMTKRTEGTKYGILALGDRKSKINAEATLSFLCGESAKKEIYKPYMPQLIVASAITAKRNDKSFIIPVFTEKGISVCKRNNVLSFKYKAVNEETFNNLAKELIAVDAVVGNDIVNKLKTLSLNVNNYLKNPESKSFLASYDDCNLLLSKYFYLDGIKINPVLKTKKEEDEIENSEDLTGDNQEDLTWDNKEKTPVVDPEENPVVDPEEKQTEVPEENPEEKQTEVYVAEFNGNKVKSVVFDSGTQVTFGATPNGDIIYNILSDATCSFEQGPNGTIVHIEKKQESAENERTIGDQPGIE